MANLVLQSERQVQTGLLTNLIARLGLNDVNAGSVLDILTQAIAQQDFSLYYQLAQLSRLVDIDELTGDDLDNKAFEYGLTRFQAVSATGTISIFRPVGFTKVSTTFYAGLPSPVAGDTTINVNDASNLLIGSSGTLVLGRGTNNEEQVNYAIAPVNNITYWTFTLTAPLVNDHIVQETIILKQGTDESILAGTVVSVPATGVTNEIQFSTQTDVTLLSGENEVDDVEVIATQPGSSGNIPIGAISGTSAFPNPPFPGAQAKNLSKFTSGRDLETDDQLRDRIKNTIQSLSRGVKQAIKNAIVGLVDPVTAKRVVSADIVLPVTEVGPVKIYIDDGTGFEPSFLSVGFEIVKDSATGGETRLQLDQFPVVKAQVESNNSAPYDMSSGSLTLQYLVGTIPETITFNPADFRIPSVSGADDIAAAINNKANLIEARTSEGGIKIVITAKSDTNEDIQVTGGTANAIIAFPTVQKTTLNLYRDDSEITKDGATAIIDSGNLAPYDLLAIGSYPHTLTMIVDKKTANPQTATINLADVAVPAAVTVQEIADVINRDIAGLTAFGINSNTSLRLQSNINLSSKSAIHVTGGSANNAINGLNFSTVEVIGSNADYIFNRELGIISLTDPLTIDESVTAGSIFTRARLRAANAELYAPANGTTLIIVVDGGANQTITFDPSFAGGLSAQLTADFINATLKGATAIVREIGGFNYLEINTNTYDTSGSLEILSSSTGNSAFGFTEDTIVTSASPNKAYQVSGTSEPYIFAQDDSLVIVIDNDIVNNTFAIDLSYPGSLTQVTSTSQFKVSQFSNIFVQSGVLDDFFVAFTSGGNTTSGTLTTVALLGGGVARYTFSVAPAGFGTYVVGDLAKVTGFNNSENNGNFVIQALGATTIDVINVDAIATSSETATGLLSQKRQISNYTAGTGDIQVSSPFSNLPVISDNMIVMPSTVDNLVYFMNNLKISSFSLKGIAEGVDNDTKLQISSNSQGSDGYVEITGGKANDKLQFSTNIYRGIEAYSYWTGLLALVHKTIYGDDKDLVSFPGYGAAGITFQVLAPTIQRLHITLDITLAAGISIASLTNEIKSAVTGYVNALGVGDDVIIEEIRAAVIAVNGVIDVSMSEPLANIAIADNEIARVSESDILIG
jgi:uncharacterized phage protein gp47/JayE